MNSMDRKIKETMDVTSFSREELDVKVEEFLHQGWEIISGIDESVFTPEDGLYSTISFTRTLGKFE